MLNPLHWLNPLNLSNLQRVKICGITHPEQAQAIARGGATTLGFICVPASPRFVSTEQIAEMTAAVRSIESDIQRSIEFIGVFANADIDTMIATALVGGLTGIQLHGDESPDDCKTLRTVLPELELIKAFRIRAVSDLEATTFVPYTETIDTFLLDAYHPDQLGGTGQTLDWDALEAFTPPKPWFLAGGLKPANVREALTRLHPTGIDVSSGVERSPGDKDLQQVEQLFQMLH